MLYVGLSESGLLRPFLLRQRTTAMEGAMSHDLFWVWGFVVSL